MKSLQYAVLGLVIVTAAQSEASVLRPIRPVVPVVPIGPVVPVVPVIPVRPIRPIRPVIPVVPVRPPVVPIVPVQPPVVPIVPIAPAPSLDWQDIGAASYAGAGFRYEDLDAGGRFATFLQVRVPATCGLVIAPIQVSDDGMLVGVRRVNSWNDGAYSHFVYQIGDGSRTAKVDQVRVGIQSSVYIYPQQSCGVRVYLAEGTSPFLPANIR